MLDLAALLSFQLLSYAVLAVPAVSPQILRQRQDITTRNDLYDLPCMPTTLIFARGTIEPGNVGLFAGPPFFDALSQLIGNTFAVQGVEYPANIMEYLQGGSPEGAQTFADLANLAHTQCPDSRLVLSGYSQGAQVVHLGSAMLGEDVLSTVAAVVLFGDPDEGQPIANVPTVKVDTICFSGDFICDGLPIVDPLHLSYALTAGQAAEFVASLL